MKTKAYFFVNDRYMSEKQFGIQGMHCLSKIARDFSDNSCYLQWVNEDETIVLLRGTNCKRLHEIDQIAFSTEYPSGVFYEDEDSLNGAITCVGVIVPNVIYDAPRDMNLNRYAIINKLSNEAKDLAYLIANSKTV